MADLPIAPDESEGIPECAVTCPHYITRPGTAPDECALEPEMAAEGAYLCLPRIRELLALSRRRCDGCLHWDALEHRRDSGWCSVWGSKGVGAEAFCSRWEAKP